MKLATLVYLMTNQHDYDDYDPQPLPLNTVGELVRKLSTEIILTVDEVVELQQMLLHTYNEEHNSNNNDDDDDDDDAVDDGYETMTVKTLNQVAKTKGLTGYSRLRKDALIELLRRK
eukprot:134413-Heterocapsa_arctica.AAC.1